MSGPTNGLLGRLVGELLDEPTSRLLGGLLGGPVRELESLWAGPTRLTGPKMKPATNPSKNRLGLGFSASGRAGLEASLGLGLYGDPWT